MTQVLGSSSSPAVASPAGPTRIPSGLGGQGLSAPASVGVWLRRSCIWGHLLPEVTTPSSVTSHERLEVTGEVVALWLFAPWKQTTGFGVWGAPAP